MSDVIEAMRMVHALSGRGFKVVAVGKDVVVDFADIKSADAAIRELRQEHNALDWSKVEIDWYERTTLRRNESGG